MKDFSDEKIKHIVDLGLEKISKNEATIILNDISERAIAHKFAEYLQLEFQGYNVDVEYNRNAEKGKYEPKYALILRNDFDIAFDKVSKSNKEDIKFFFDQVTTYPDIIVHDRGNNDHNVLVVEMKKSTNKGDWSIDEKKLQAFTRSIKDEGYGYQLGLHIVFHIENEWVQPSLNWYKLGHKIK